MRWDFNWALKDGWDLGRSARWSGQEEEAEQRCQGGVKCGAEKGRGARRSEEASLPGEAGFLRGDEAA